MVLAIMLGLSLRKKADPESTGLKWFPTRWRQLLRLRLNVGALVIRIGFL